MKSIRLLFTRWSDGGEKEDRIVLVSIAEKSALANRLEIYYPLINAPPADS